MGDAEVGTAAGAVIRPAIAGATFACLWLELI